MDLLTGNHEILDELSSNSLAHLQISLDSNAADILYHLCTTKLTTLLRTFQKFEIFGPLELYPLLYNAGLIGIRRGENGIILSCVPTMVTATTLHGYCCANQPVLLPEEKKGTTPTHFLEPLTHQILSTCDPLTCSDILPVTFYTNNDEPICQTPSGIIKCHAGTIIHPTDTVPPKFRPLTVS